MREYLEGVPASARLKLFPSGGRFGFEHLFESP
jgi:hypothetical protein